MKCETQFYEKIRKKLVCHLLNLFRYYTAHNWPCLKRSWTGGTWSCLCNSHSFHCYVDAYFLVFSLLAKDCCGHSEIVFLFCLKIGFDISCKLSPQETICMKCEILFCDKIRKNIRVLPADCSDL